MTFGSIISDMVIDMNETRLKTVAQLRAFLNGTLDVKFQSISNDAQRYRVPLRLSPPEAS